MKLLKMAFAVALAAASGSAYAFHDGGVATCESCHTMHNSSAKETGALAPQMTNNNMGVGVTNPYLLQGQDASSTCLACHGATSAGSYHVLDTNALAVAGQLNTNTMNMTPGGEFGWLQTGPRKGHNVVAADYTTSLPNANETRKAPPGYTGSWTGTDFSCVSCHDPHGQSRFTSATTQARQAATATGEAIGTGLPPIAESGSYGGTRFAAYDAAGTAGSYRLLGGTGWAPKTSPGQPAFAVNAPVALAPATYNKSETSFALNAAGHTGQTVVAYLSGMSEWCGTCHGNFHGEAASGTLAATVDKHPSGLTATLGAGLAANYNKYIKTGDLNGTKAYDALVPVELNIARDQAAADLAVDITGQTNITVGAGANVMCLTCHRAHASGFDSMLRWEIYEFNDIGSATALANGASNHNKTLGYYARAATSATSQYGEYQRMMCNKCHVKD
jgi:cytochrome c553